MLNGTFASFPVLTTERLTLRQLAITDEKEIFNLRSDSDINKYLDRQISHRIDDARNFINRIVKSNALYWAITPGSQKHLAGTICLFDFSDDNHKCEIGYELMTKFQGQGIMKEAAEKVIEYAFHTLEVKKIEAFMHKDNQPSIKLLKKLAFNISPGPGNTNTDLIGYYLTN